MKRAVKLLTATVVVGAGAVAGTYYFTDHELPVLGSREEAASAAEVELSGDRIRITGGETTVVDLDRTLESMGEPDLIVAEVGGIVLNAGIDVLDDGTLQSSGGELRLRSDPDAITTVVVGPGGSLELRDTDVRSWDTATGAGDANPTDGRAFITSDGGRIEIDGGTFADLGVDEPAKRGLTLGPAPTSGPSHRVAGASVTGSIVGVELIDANDAQLQELVIEDAATSGLIVERSVGVRIDGVQVLRSVQDAVLLRSRATDVEIEHLVVRGNGSIGVRLEDNVADITISDADISGSPRSAVSIFDSSDITVASSELWSNEVGVEVSGTADSVVISGNRISANRRAGVELVSAGSVATISDNRIEHNGAGVLISDGNAVIGPGNEITANNTGIKSVDAGPGLVIRDNEVTENFGDGLLLVATTGVEVRGNDISGNAFAAFGLFENGDFAADFRANNDVGGGGRYGWVRVLQEYEIQLVRGSGPVAARNPNPEPVGYFFLKSQDLERSLGELDPGLYPEAARALAELQAQQDAQDAARAGGTP